MVLEEESHGMYHNPSTALLVVSSIAPALIGRISRGAEIKSYDQTALLTARVQMCPFQRDVMLHISRQDYAITWAMLAKMRCSFITRTGTFDKCHTEAYCAIHGGSHAEQ